MRGISGKGTGGLSVFAVLTKQSRSRRSHGPPAEPVSARRRTRREYESLFWRDRIRQLPRAVPVSARRKARNKSKVCSAGTVKESSQSVNFASGVFIAVVLSL